MDPGGRIREVDPGGGSGRWIRVDPPVAGGLQELGDGGERSELYSLADFDGPRRLRRALAAVGSRKSAPGGSLRAPIRARQRHAAAEDGESAVRGLRAGQTVARRAQEVAVRSPRAQHRARRQAVAKLDVLDLLQRGSGGRDSTAGSGRGLAGGGGGGAGSGGQAHDVARSGGSFLS